MVNTIIHAISSKKTLRLEPVAKALNSVITWQSLLFHPEAMTTLSIEVQFDRVAGISPRGIERQTCSRTHRVIVGRQQKQRRSISWYGNTRSRKGRVNWRGEVWTTLFIVLHGRAGGDNAAA